MGKFFGIFFLKFFRKFGEHTVFIISWACSKIKFFFSKIPKKTILFGHFYCDDDNGGAVVKRLRLRLTIERSGIRDPPPSVLVA